MSCPPGWFIRRSMPRCVMIVRIVRMPESVRSGLRGSRQPRRLCEQREYSEFGTVVDTVAQAEVRPGG